MKGTVVKYLLLSVCLLAVSLAAQDTKRVVLSPKSNVSTAEIAEGFQKHCPNVRVTEDSSKAAYVLEAAENDRVSDGDSVRQWYFTLLNKEGDVLFTTHPKMSFGNRFAHHFEDTCKFINGGKKKK
jgi:hypothetical protein